MPRPWTKEEERQKFQELHRLYIKEGKTIGEVDKILGIAEQTVFQRLQLFNIPSKKFYLKLMYLR